MCCMQNKSNSKWLFTCRTLEVKMTTSHTTDVHYIKYIYMYIYIDNICKRDSSGDKWRFFRWSPCCWLTTAVIHTCVLLILLHPDAQLDIVPRAGVLTNVGEAIQCFPAGSCLSHLWRAVLLCPSSLQSFTSQVLLVWSSAATNPKQPSQTWVCLLLFLCPLLNSGYRQSSWYRKHFQHICVLTGSKPFRSSMTTVCWSPRAVMQQKHGDSNARQWAALSTANVRASPQLWNQASARLKMDLQTESSVSPVSQDNLHRQLNL